MPAGPVDILRRCRRPIAAIAIVLAVLQSVIAGLATGQAAAALAPNPFDSAICHGAGGSGPADGTAPTEQHGSTCCTYCLAAAPALPVFKLPAVPAWDGTLVSTAAVLPDGFIPIAWRAVRAGTSQAPPGLITS